TQDFMNYYRIYAGKQAEDMFDYNQYGGSSNIGTWEKTNRMYIWDSALKVVKENPVFGVGTGDVVTSLNVQYEKDGRSFLAVYDTNTHNQFLDYMVRYGLLGLFLILIVFGLYFKVAVGRRDPIYLSILLLFLLAMMTENILDRQHGVVLFAYLNSIYFLARKESELLLLR
ncbi:MAG: O-antigen ligase family protein, partial [Flavobacteriaceae bacterium]